MKNIFFCFAIIATCFACSKYKANPKNEPSIDVDAVSSRQIRIILSLPTTLENTKNTENYYLSGSFKDPNFWIEKGKYKFTLVKNGLYEGKLQTYIDFDDFMTSGQLYYKVLRNGEFNYIERNADCQAFQNRVLVSTLPGKTIKIKADNFRNTGGCGN